MAYEKSDDTAFLFRNEKKEKDAQPDYTGWVKYDGKERRLAAWVKDMRDGSKALSIKISDKQEPKPQQRSAPTDDIPF
tara:strand:+ start:6129 stop:6362 length:234 start_codon:yes stop_codon:yes gene_type:complete